MAHDFPAPHAETPQQTPSVQNSGDVHGAVLLQGIPSPGAGTHAPVLQTKPAAQSARVVHVVAHLVPTQAKAPQVLGTSLHFPTPSQELTCVSTPPLQPSALHLVTAAGGKTQSARLLPSQCRPQSPPTTPPLQTALGARGAPTTATHVPALPVSLQASHCPAQGLSQQTESTQLSEAHSLALVHAAPFAFLATQVPEDPQYEGEKPLQMLVLQQVSNVPQQSASEAHDDAQAPETHAA